MTFDQWLKLENYASTTARSTLRMIATAEEAWEAGEPLEDYTPYLKRMVTWMLDTEHTPQTAFEDAVYLLLSPVEPRVLGERNKMPLNELQWNDLVAILAKSDSETDLAVSILLSLPYPSSDVRVTLSEDLPELRLRVPPPMRTAVGRVARAGAGNLEDYLGGTSDGAYKRISRRLNTLGESLGFSKMDLSVIEKTDWAIRQANPVMA